jgi:hypothetical protein
VHGRGFESLTFWEVNGGAVHGPGFESLTLFSIQSVQSSMPSIPYFTDRYSNYSVFGQLPSPVWIPDK